MRRTTFCRLSMICVGVNLTTVSYLVYCWQFYWRLPVLECSPGRSQIPGEVIEVAAREVQRHGALDRPKMNWRVARVLAGNPRFAGPSVWTIERISSSRYKVSWHNRSTWIESKDGRWAWLGGEPGMFPQLRRRHQNNKAEQAGAGRP